VGYKVETPQKTGFGEMGMYTRRFQIRRTAGVVSAGDADQIEGFRDGFGRRIGEIL
jgi:hypothetical protein